MTTYPRQKLYDVGHGRFFKAAMTGNLNDGQPDDFVSQFKQFIGTDYSVIPMSRGRLGIYFAVKYSISETRNKVLMSPFTIFDVINMVVAAGGEPVFTDSVSHDPNVSVGEISAKMTDDVAAVIVTHYHRSNRDIEKIAELTSRANVKLIEDCAISLGGKPAGKSVGLHGDFGMFSFGLFKFVATYFGGALVVKDPATAAKIEADIADWPKMEAKDLRPYMIKGMKLTTLTSPVIFNTLTFPLFRLGYINNIAWVKKQAVNDPEPIIRDSLPDMYKRRPSDFQQREWARQLPKVLDNKAARLKIAKVYHEKLSGNNIISIPFDIVDEQDCYLNFPVMVPNRDKVLSDLMSQGFDASQYFYRNCSTIDAFNKYGTDLPNISEFVDQVLLLPTYPGIDSDYAARLADTLKSIVEKHD